MGLAGIEESANPEVAETGEAEGCSFDSTPGVVHLQAGTASGRCSARRPSGAGCCHLSGHLRPPRGMPVSQNTSRTNGAYAIGSRPAWAPSVQTACSI